MASAPQSSLDEPPPQQALKSKAVLAGSRGGATSQYSGVYREPKLDGKAKQWRGRVRFTLDGKSKCESLGYFREEVEAARAVDQRLMEVRGRSDEYFHAVRNLVLNFPVESAGVVGAAAGAGAGAGAAAGASVAASEGAESAGCQVCRSSDG